MDNSYSSFPYFFNAFYCGNHPLDLQKTRFRICDHIYKCWDESPLKIIDLRLKERGRVKGAVLLLGAHELDSSAMG